MRVRDDRKRGHKTHARGRAAGTHITFWLPSIAGAVAATVAWVALALLFLIEREDREVALRIIKGQRR